MRRIEGGCHCGNLRFELDWPDHGPVLEVRACSCSFCRAHVAEYLSHRDARLRLRVADQSRLSRYRFGTATADFLICARCGVVAAATCEVEQRLLAVVNVNAFDELTSFRLMTTVTDFDGEEVGDRLARRARTWIPDMSLTVGAG